MDRHLTITPLLINHHPLPQANHWVKIFIYEPTDEEVLETRGKMYALLAFSSKVPVDFAAVMQLILEELQSEYFQQSEGGILATLEHALDSIHKKLLLLGQQDKRLSAGFNFNLLTAVSWGTVLYIGRLGSSRAALWRDGRVQHIDDEEADTTTLYLASGMLQAGDRVMLATEELLAKISNEQLRHSLGLAQDLLVEEVEGFLDDGELGEKQSGIVLTIDLQEVPSPIDEAIRIGNPDQTRPSIRRHPLAGLWQTTQPLRQRLPSLPVLLAILASLVLVSSIAWTTLRPHASTKMVVDVSPVTNRVQQEVQQAQDVADVNPDRAQELLNTARQDLGPALAARPNDPHVQTLQSQIQELEAKLTRTTVLHGVIPLATVDVALTQPKLVLEKGQVYMVDSSHDQLVQYNDRGQKRVLKTDQVALTHALLTTTTTGLAALSTTQLTPISLAGGLGKARTVPEGHSFSAMASYHQNVYGLDVHTGQVYRFTEQADGYSAPSPYLKQPADANGLVDVGVDGNLYLLRSSGVVEQYLNGVKQSFSLERSSLAQGAKALLVDEQTTKIYIITKQAIGVWDKEGKYQEQYQLEDSAPITAAAVDEGEKTLYILSGKQLLKAKM